jgi:hypothetical protein
LETEPYLNYYHYYFDKTASDTNGDPVCCSRTPKTTTADGVVQRSYGANDY